MFSKLFKSVMRDSFRNWKDIVSGLSCLDTECYRQQLEFLVKKGFGGQLSATEKKGLLNCITQAAAGNLKAAKDLPKPADAIVVGRLGTWLTHVYNTDGYASIPKQVELTPIAVTARSQAMQNIREVYQFLSSTRGEKFDPTTITDTDRTRVTTWGERVVWVMGRIWVICDAELPLEDALCIPSMAGSFYYEPQLGMIRWVEREVTILRSGPAAHTGAIPPTPAGTRLNLQVVKGKLAANGWKIVDERGSPW